MKYQHNSMAIQEGKEIDEWVLEDAELIQQHQKFQPDNEMDATICMHQNLIKMANLLGRFSRT